MNQSDTVRRILLLHGLTDGMKRKANICTCDHKLQGTGAIFLQSMGLLFCNNCKGWQEIKRPIE